MPLTDRWYTLRPHKDQYALATCKSRFVVVPAGRRSGKTEIAKRRLVMALAEKTAYPEANYFAAAPTYSQAKAIYWQDLKALTPKEWIRSISETELKITTHFNTSITVMGLDKPERIEGRPWDGGVLDEYANMKAGVWGENVRPALADRNGWCWLIGVPEGLNHYKDIYDYAVGEDDPEWGHFTWFSSTVLPDSEIESAKRMLDLRTFRQEYEASFEDAQGQVYYAYSKENQVDCEINPNYPLILCVDFNVDPCIWEVAQEINGTVFVVDEIRQQNTNTPEMTKEYLTRYGNYSTIVYGDSAGSARSTAGKSDYAIMSEMGLRRQVLKKANPRVKDRVNAVNAMLCNAKGQRKLLHSPRCTELKKDFQKVVWKGQDINKSDILRTHASDALGYFIEYEFGHNMYKPDPNKRYYK
jgi:hypothetical protein